MSTLNEDLVRKYIEAHAVANERMAASIDECFFALLRLHKSAGKTTAEAAQAAVDDMNKAAFK